MWTFAAEAGCPRNLAALARLEFPKWQSTCTNFPMRFGAMRRARDARFWPSKLVITWAIIGPLIAGIVLGIVPSAGVTIAAPGPGVLDSELRYLSSADDYVRSRPASANGYGVPLM